MQITQCMSLRLCGCSMHVLAVVPVAKQLRVGTRCEHSMRIDTSDIIFWIFPTRHVSVGPHGSEKDGSEKDCMKQADQLLMAQ